MSFRLPRLLSPALTPSLIGMVILALNTAAARADDLTISDTRTTPANTAAGNGTGPGDITISSAGAVNLTTGIPVTLNSDNSVTNNGQISVEAESNVTGILVDGTVGNLVGNIVNNGVISIPGPATDSSLIDTPVNNIGIYLSGPGSLTGSIVNDSAG